MRLFYFILIFCVNSVCGQDFNTIDTLVEQGNFIKADSLLNTKSYQNSNSHFLPYYKGRCALGNEEIIGAKPYFEKAISINHLHKESRYYKAYCLYLYDDYKNSFLDLNKLIKVYPDYCDAYFLLGVIEYQGINIYDKAVEYFYKALENCNDEKAEQILPYLGLSFEELEEYEKAIYVYNDLLELNSEHILGLEMAGILKNEVGYFDEAIEHLNNYTKQDTTNKNVYATLAYAYTAKENFNLALNAYHQAYKLDTNDAEILFNKATTLTSAGKYNQAIIDFSKALTISPKDADIYFNRANAYYAIEDYKNCIKDLTNYLALKPDDTEAYLNRGFAKYYNKDKNGACADWKNLIRLGKKQKWKEVKVYCED